MVNQRPIIALLILFIVSCTPATPGSSFTPTAKLLPTPISLETPSSTNNEPALIFFVSEQGRFEAWMPVSESIIEYTVTQTLFEKSITCVMTVSRLNSASAIVQYCDLTSEDVASQSADTILKAARDLLQKGFRLKIDQEQRETVNNSYSALTLSGEQDMRGLGYDGTFKARIILVGNRVYFVHMSVYHIDWCNCLHQRDQVLDSFYVNPEMSIPFEPTP